MGLLKLVQQRQPSVILQFSAGSYSITTTVTDNSGSTSAPSAASNVSVNSALVLLLPLLQKLQLIRVKLNFEFRSRQLLAQAYTYQWIQMAPNSTSYSAISGATSSSYPFATTRFHDCRFLEF